MRNTTNDNFSRNFSIFLVIILLLAFVYMYLNLNGYFKFSSQSQITIYQNVCTNETIENPAFIDCMNDALSIGHISGYSSISQEAINELSNQVQDAINVCYSMFKNKNFIHVESYSQQEVQEILIKQGQYYVGYPYIYNESCLNYKTIQEQIKFQENMCITSGGTLSDGDKCYLDNLINISKKDLTTSWLDENCKCINQSCPEGYYKDIAEQTPYGYYSGSDWCVNKNNPKDKDVYLYKKNRCSQYSCGDYEVDVR